MMISKPALRALSRLSRKHSYTGMRMARVTVRQMFDTTLYRGLLKAIIVSDLRLLTKRRVCVRILDIFYPFQVCPTNGTTVKCKFYSTVPLP
jgi:hypothetical protein